MEENFKYAVGFRWKDSDGNWCCFYDTIDFSPFRWLSAFAVSRDLDLENLCFDFSVMVRV